MTGAVACLAGFEDVAVIVHGSSGCYFYPASLLPYPIYGSHLIETEIIFGSGARLQEVVTRLPGTHTAVAVVTTCVPAIMGEDIKTLLSGVRGVLVVDAPGFIGEFDNGWRAALQVLPVRVDPGQSGVNVDGLNPIDPFYRGNILEARRLLSLAGLSPGTFFSSDRFPSLSRAGPFTLTTNPDLAGTVGIPAGSLLGLEGTRRAFSNLGDEYPEIHTDAVEREITWAEERIDRVCDKFLRRHNPPAVAIFGPRSYALHAADLLTSSLDASILFVGSRNGPIQAPFPVEEVTEFPAIKERIEKDNPDLVLGSSYEQSVCGDAAFVPLTPPIRGRILLHARPLIGPEGALLFIEEILNACLDHSKKKEGGVGPIQSQDTIPYL